jgi:hypothetical protein
MPGTLWRFGRSVAMSDPKDTPPPVPAETARQEGAQGRAGKGPGDTVPDGAVDASDPKIADIADQVHANA